MFLLTPLLFFMLAAAIVMCWNRCFDPVPARVGVALAAIVTIYMGETLFTAKVDVPADLAYHAYPWKALGHEGVKANTGIVLTQMIPWTETARRAMSAGEMPLWNRTIGAGSPLLANLQTSILHPFNAVGLLLPIGEAWTLSAALRLFSSVFFMFVFLSQWRLHRAAAMFGAISYTFCSFNIISLLFPLGLTMMTLPMCLAAVQELLTRPRRRSFVLLIVAFTLTILGGHPESSAWVALTSAAYATYLLATHEATARARITRLGIASLAAVASVLVTAPFWFPAAMILPHTERFSGLSSDSNPVDHKIGADWMLPLFVPNILGTPQRGSYRVPEPAHVTLPGDYGEVAATYAGVAALALALAACSVRRRPFAFFAGAMIVSFLTVYETPGWYDAVRSIPWVGIGLHQRWRFLWALGAAVNGSIALNAIIDGSLSAARAKKALLITASGIAAIYFFRLKEFFDRDVVGEQLAWAALSLGVLALLVLALRRSIAKFATAAIALTLIELVAVMFRYNPPTSPDRFYPETGAIRALQRFEKPSRMVALGWSFLPDIPGYYGLEDVKTTDVVQYQGYLKLYRYFLDTAPGDFNQTIRKLDSPFLDFLNVAAVYVPPDGALLAAKGFERVYQGKDGSVYRNREVLPRYFFVSHAKIRSDFQEAAKELDALTDLKGIAIVDHVPVKIERMSDSALSRGSRELTFTGGAVRVASYRGSSTLLNVTSEGWNLLVSSDVNMPGWRVWWNGERLPPVIVNGAFLGTFVPPGKGQLRFRYRPDDFEDSVKVSVASLLALAIGLAIAKRWTGDSAKP